ncbi:MAG: hypothetical protein JWM25_1696 [Thermoleophilia bacterium]|nr:hypothetical protein [Thermoleophilia bacterium]MCZ4497111.1 hypothetical protein [Thermoleophilia bacterium]
MQIQTGIPQKLFPKYTAALQLVKDHGVDGSQHAMRAAKGTTGGARLDAAIRAMTSFDHALDNAGKLPLSIFVPDAARFLSGYDAAKAAVMLLVSTGVVPGAREYLGRSTLQAARTELDEALRTNVADRSKFGARVSAGWLEATSEDAATGVVMLQRSPELGRTLLSGIDQARRAALAGRTIDAALGASLGNLLDKADQQLGAQIELAAKHFVPVDEAIERDVFTRVDALLAQAAAY